MNIEQGVWKCKGMSGTGFPEVDLTEGEWNDYDEKVSPDIKFTARFYTLF